MSSSPYRPAYMGPMPARRGRRRRSFLPIFSIISADFLFYCPIIHHHRYYYDGAVYDAPPLAALGSLCYYVGPIVARRRCAKDKEESFKNVNLINSGDDLSSFIFFVVFIILAFIKTS